MDDITIVTGYFNINRESWNNYKRTSNDYLDYFKQWCCIENDMVIYLDNQDYYDIVLAARKKHGLRDKTKVVVIANTLEIDRRLYDSIEKVSENNIHKSFRLQPNNPEVINPKYDYVMLLKEWCVADAINKGLVKGKIAWIDFGFNHGGDTIRPDTFNGFNWQYPFPEKICLFSCEEVQYERPIFDIVRNMSVYIMGTVIVAPDYLWLKLWDYVRDAMHSLCDCGMIDDDQTILLMVLYKHREECEVFASSWNKQLYDYSKEKKLRIEKNERTTKKASIAKRIVREIRWIKYKLKYCRVQYNQIRRLK